MRKRERQQLIKEILIKKKIGRQMDLQKQLIQHGCEVTQTTLSRDMRELGLTKVHDGQQSFYAVQEPRKKASLVQVLATSTKKVERASFVLVFHTRIGEAAMMANAIDREQPETILGTIAGADTLLAICRSEEAAQEVQSSIQSYLG